MNHPTDNGSTPGGDGKLLAEAKALLNGNFRSAQEAEEEEKAEKLANHRFRPLGMAELVKLPPKEWLVDSLFGQGDLLMLYGPSGVGKTFVVIDLIFAACLARPFAGHFKVARPLAVAYCAGEGAGGLAQRFAAAAHFYGVTDLPNFYFYREVPQLAGLAQLSRSDTSLRCFVDEWKERHQLGLGPAELDLLIIDTLHSATVGMDENSSKDAGLVLETVKYAVQELKCAVMVLHHTNKAKSGERGSSAFRGAMDLMVEVVPAGKTYTIKCEKLKDGVAWKARPFELMAKAASARVEWLEPGSSGGPATNGEQAQDREKLVAALANHTGVKLTAKQLAEVLGKSDTHTRHLLAGLVEEGQCQRTLLDPDKRSSNRNPWVYSI